MALVALVDGQQLAVALEGADDEIVELAGAEQGLGSTRGRSSTM